MKLEKISNEEIQKKKPTIAELRKQKRTPLYIIFENVRSMHNIGAMFRTSDGALVEKIFLTGITPCPPKKEIDKSALGATDVVPWEYCADVSVPIENLKSKGVSIIALELARQSVPYFKFQYKFPMCLVVGNEVDGISQNLLNMCDAAIDIPMLGRANSLNVATAYGIAVYEILRQYKNAKPENFQ